jgi:glutaredoxin 3
MSRVVMYSTEPCGFCRTAKALLNARKIPYEEINLAKDPDGRAALVADTGRMTFPQIVIDGTNIGGFQELARLDGAGRLRELSEPAAA